MCKKGGNPPFYLNVREEGMKALIDYIDTKEKEMLTLLEKRVNIDFGTYDMAGVDRFGDVLAER